MINTKVIAIREGEFGEALDVVVVDDFTKLGDTIIEWSGDRLGPKETVKIYLATHTMTFDISKGKALGDALNDG